jgi:RimJ/RimL family protein N-acetyltransferase
VAEEMTPPYETDRFVLRRFGDGDLDELAAMVADEEQMRFYPRPKTRDEASAWLSRNLELYRDPGYGIWLIESRATSRFLGYCGIRPLVLDGAAEVEVAWHVRKTCWGRGVATETAAAARDAAFGRFGVFRLVAIIPPEHAASRRVAEKIGMRYERATTVDGEPLVVYGIARS